MSFLPDEQSSRQRFSSFPAIWELGLAVRKKTPRDGDLLQAVARAAHLDPAPGPPRNQADRGGRRKPSRGNYTPENHHGFRVQDVEGKVVIDIFWNHLDAGREGGA